MMRLFGKDRENIVVKGLKANRTVVDLHHPEISCDIRVITEDGEKLDITIPDRLLPKLIQQLTITYEAIHPPVRSGSRQATWQGMDI